MKQYDLIVVGGGMAGVAAAVSGAREGLSVLLIERSGCLGGAMANSLVYPFMQYETRDGKLLSAGIFVEMLERKKSYGNASWEYFKCVFDDMVTQANVDVLFHAAVFETKTEDRRIKSVSVATRSGVSEYEAGYFIDCSGDGELIAMAGCDYQLGRESDGLSQPMTTCFRVCGVDVEQYKRESARNTGNGRRQIRSPTRGRTSWLFMAMATGSCISIPRGSSGTIRSTPWSSAGQRCLRASRSSK